MFCIVSARYSWYSSTYELVSRRWGQTLSYLMKFLIFLPFVFPQTFKNITFKHGTLFPKRNAGLIYPFFLLILGHWPWPRVMPILSCKCYLMSGSLIYILPQKNGNLQEPAFLLGKSVEAQSDRLTASSMGNFCKEDIFARFTEMTGNK